MKIYPNGDGTFCVSDGYWLPGVFDSEAAAKLAVKLDDAALREVWEKCLSEGREVLSWAEVFSANLTSKEQQPPVKGEFDHEKYGNWD